MNARTANPSFKAPPLWLAALAAAVLAAALLFAFVDTLQEHLRHVADRHRLPAQAAQPLGATVAAAQDATARPAPAVRLR